MGLAAALSASWRGDLVAYVTDNQHARAWLTKRQAKCKLARHILRILGLLELRHHFKTMAFYIRTYRNVAADWLSRETKKVVAEQMGMDGGGVGELGAVRQGVRRRHLPLARR